MATGTAGRRAAGTRRSLGAALRTTRYPPGRAGPGSHGVAPPTLGTRGRQARGSGTFVAPYKNQMPAEVERLAAGRAHGATPDASRGRRESEDEAEVEAAACSRRGRTLDAGPGSVPVFKKINREISGFPRLQRGKRGNIRLSPFDGEGQRGCGR